MTQSEFSALLAPLQKTDVLKGAVLASGDREKLDFCICAGFADIAETVPLRTDTVFDMASVTKVVVTASLLMRLCQAGKISLDAPFTDYLPDYHGTLLHPVTVRELAAHISGFDHIMQSETGHGTQAGMLALSPAFPPRQRMAYSCGNYLLLSMLLERMTGKTLPELAEQEIFQPCGMTHTRLGAPWTQDPALLMQSMGTPHAGMISDQPARRCYEEHLSSGNAGLFSTAEELSLFCRMMLRGGAPLFTPESFRELSTSCVAEAFPEQRGIGWITRNAFTPAHASGYVIYHCGWSGQTVFMDLEAGRFVIVLSVRSGDYAAAKKWRYDLIDRMLSSR